MSRVTVRVTGGTQIRAAMRAVGHRAEAALGGALYQEAEAIMALSKQTAPVGTDGVLRNSGFVKLPVKVGTRTLVELGYGGAAAGYAVYVHEGTGPAVGRPAYFPPPAALERWVKKFIPGADENTAFLVARAIGKRGTKPTKFLERPLRERARGMADRLAKRVRALGGMKP